MKPLRVLIAHNAYQQRGGEDSVVEAEAALLRDYGHAVFEWRRSNDELAALGRARAAAQTLWSRDSHAEAQALIERHRPDVVHVHNTFARLSPSIYWACARRGVPVVQTLHNFRLACPQAMLLREGRVCEDCLGRLPLPALRHGCYRGSRAQTAALAGMLVLHRALGTWQHKVTRYIALNDFCRAKFIAAGLPAHKLRVKPNFVDFAPPRAGTARAGLLYVGRLAEEKGIALLAEALPQVPPARLRVLGSGPLQGLLENQPQATLLGPQPMNRVHAEMATAAALVMPSIWYENFPRTLVEAFAAGLPVIASRIGALAELVVHGETGLLFEPGDAQDLARQIAWAVAHPQALAHMGERARAVYEAQYTPQRNHALLREIYEEAIADHG
jgi:glycosyltransferase involved in cell wall biosynthesis